jgi:hypothetical protein
MPRTVSGYFARSWKKACRVAGHIAAGAGLSLAAAGPVRADTVAPPKVTASVERHFTTNALDSDRALSDWYTLLRGSLKREWGSAAANFTLSAEVQATRHDHVRIEDDRAILIAAQAFRRLRTGLELRGALTYRATSDGDDLPIGPLTLGTRTPKQVFGAEGQLGVDLGNSATLVLEASDRFEAIGRSRFQSGLLPPAQLDADRNRLQVGFRIARTTGRLTFGSSGSALLVSVEQLGTPPIAVGFQLYALRGEFAWAGADGSTFGAAVGAEFMHAAGGLYSRARPNWKIAFKKPLPGNFELRGTYCGRFEDLDSDDPLASWLQRAELETGLTVNDRLALSAGLFRQIKQNLLFENEERSHGLYAEAAYRLTASTTAVVRVDASKTFKTILDAREDTVDVFLAWRANL